MTCLSCIPKPDASYTSGCACDFTPFPPCDAIPPGLPQLPRQVLGFPQYRENLLSTAATRPEFLGWAARAVDDLGVLLLESWAYVLDIVQFYDRRIAEESYIRTARDPASLRRLVGLLGYRPRPAVSSSAIVAAIADGHDPVTIPAGTQLRSKASPGVPAQLFESRTASAIDPRINSWQLGPIRKKEYSGVFAFAPGETGVLPGQTVALVVGGTPAAAAIVAWVKAMRMPDGTEYRVTSLSPAPSFSSPPDLSTVRIYTLSQSAAPSPFPVGASTAAQSGSLSTWVLDSLYPQIAKGDVVVVETATGLSATTVQDATIASIELGTPGDAQKSVTGKATQLTFGSSFPLKRVYFRAVAAGRLINPALADIGTTALIDTLDATGTYPSVPENLSPQAFAVAGAGSAGVHLAGTVEVGPTGVAQLTGQQILDTAADALSVPIRYYGNLIEVTRGETVVNEVLGSGDSGQAFQKFRLKKKPLTYLPDASKPGSVAPQLEVRVNGVLWRQTDSFVTAKRGQRVYIVRHDDNGETDIIFGDQVRPQSGVGNITASYRFGAGKAAPPAGQLTQIVGKVQGLAQIVAPLGAGGGADAESPAAIKTNAPRSVLTYGRAVSLDDYAAITAGFPGVIASDVQWAWAKDAQTAGVQAWIVADGGAVASDLQAVLLSAGDPLIPVSVAPATKDIHSMNLSIAVSADFLPADVEAAVAQALEDPDKGMLAPPNLGIAQSLFRSQIELCVSQVAGVVAIDDLVLDGVEMPNAVSSVQGHYLSFALTVSASS